MLTIAAPSEDELHQVAVLADERAPGRLLLRLGELVRAVLRAAPLDLGGVEPGAGSTSSRAAGLVGRQAVPRGRVAGGLDGRRGGHAGASVVIVVPWLPTSSPR